LPCTLELRLQSGESRQVSGFIDEKLAVVAQEPRKNSAKALLAALRDDWKPAVEIKKQPRLKKRAADTDSHRETEISPEQAKEAVKALQEFRMSLMAPAP
jgi:hypothetical protein